MDCRETQWEEVEEAKEILQNFGVDLEKGTDPGISGVWTIIFNHRGKRALNVLNVFSGMF